jgi:hypothetical protein
LAFISIMAPRLRWCQPLALPASDRSPFPLVTRAPVARLLHFSTAEEAAVHQPSMPEAMSSTDLVKELTANASLLLQRQAKLARLEAKDELRRGKSTAGLLGSAGLAAYAGALLLLVAGALGLGEALGGRYWAGALIVAGVALVAAMVPALIGYRKLPRQPLSRTRAELSKEISWAKSRTI